ncbi:ribonuclease H1 small subunit [Setomelanomma holmii]|uniref:Ribonuclease H1 small subunit n=1 Tax=Setomelanomma holmii TaxID=210430 RepID=A0A9P4HDE4_9PLEO|nr:ribonuclease H1 small subunit [Setomelanomma holmii]
MLAIKPTAPQKCTPNLLPARINHNGPINATQRYWKPTTDDKGTQHAHFRGRHLHGTPLSLPTNYTGVVLNVIDKTLPLPRTQAQGLQDDNDDADEDMDAETEEIKIAEQIGEFDEIVVWEHGGEVDKERDGFARGLREWIGFAESMHVDEDEGEEEI